MTPRAESLLAAPRGRRLLWQLLVGRVELPDPWWHLDGADGPPTDGLPALDGIVAATTCDPVTMSELLAALAGTVDHARYWQPPSTLEQALADSEVRAALSPIAAAVERTAPAWWSADCDRAGQHLVRFGWDTGEQIGEPLEPATALAGWRQDELAQEQSFARERRRGTEPSGRWWSTPSSAPATTRAAAGLPAVHLALAEDGMGWTFADVTPVAVSDTARIVEVHRAADWATLVARYPLDAADSRRWDWWRATGVDTHWWLPDFVAMAQEVDAVHVSVAGYLDTAGRAVPVPGHDGATVLAGWGPDQTWWLRSPPERTAAPRRWRFVDDADDAWAWTAD